MPKSSGKRTTGAGEGSGLAGEAPPCPVMTHQERAEGLDGVGKSVEDLRDEIYEDAVIVGGASSSSSLATSEVERERGAGEGEFRRRSKSQEKELKTLTYTWRDLWATGSHI